MSGNTTNILKVGNAIVNTSSIKIGANVVLSANETLFIGNTSVNAVVNTSGFYQDGIVLTAPTILVNNSPVGSRTVWNFIAANGSIISGTDDAVHGQVNIIFGFTQSLPAGGPNTSVLVNDSGSPTGNSSLTYDIPTATLTLSNTFNIGSNVSLNTTRILVGNTIANSIVNSTAHKFANATTNTLVTVLGLAAGANTVVNTSALGIGNSTVSVVANSTQLTIASVAGSANLLATSFMLGAIAANATSLLIGANTLLDTTKLFSGNTTVNSTYTSTLIQLTDASSTANLTSSKLSLGANVYLDIASLSVGNTFTNLYANSSTLIVSGNTTANATLSGIGLILGNTTTVNTSQFSIGNSTFSVIANSSALQIANSTANVTINATGFFINAVSIQDVVYVINSSSSNVVLANTHKGLVIRVTNTTGSNVKVNIPNNIPVGWNCIIESGTTIAVKMTALAGTTLNSRDNRTQLANQYSQVSLMCRQNANGTAAAITMSGDLI